MPHCLYLKIMPHSGSGFYVANVLYMQDRSLSCLHNNSKHTQHWIKMVEMAEDRV